MPDSAIRKSRRGRQNHSRTRGLPLSGDSAVPLGTHSSVEPIPSIACWAIFCRRSGFGTARRGEHIGRAEARGHPRGGAAASERRGVASTSGGPKREGIRVAAQRLRDGAAPGGIAQREKNCS
jgi:hypothetical protein